MGARPALLSTIEAANPVGPAPITNPGGRDLMMGRASRVTAKATFCHTSPRFSPWACQTSPRASAATHFAEFLWCWVVSSLGGVELSGAFCWRASEFEALDLRWSDGRTAPN